ncbi:hypothetical protein ACOSP7_003296 [Xanthoceras sorbifolium]
MEQHPQAAAPSEQPYSAMPVPNDTKGSEVAINLVVEQVSASVHGLDPSGLVVEAGDALGQDSTLHGQILDLPLAMHAATVDVAWPDSNVRSALCHAVNEVP